MRRKTNENIDYWSTRLCGHTPDERVRRSNCRTVHSGMNEKQIRQIVEESEADVIIHTAAISDVGICEKNPEDSYYANVLLPVYLAKASDGKN